MRLLDQTANVVADNLAKNFVDHRHVRLAADVIAKLGLNHRKHGLDVAALMVVRGELVAGARMFMSTVMP